MSMRLPVTSPRLHGGRRAGRTAALLGTCVSVLVLVWPGTVAAAEAGCAQVPFATLVSAADVIFDGTAVTIDGELASTFEVERVFKGAVPRRVVAETFRVKYAMLEPPHRYLVLASVGDPEAGAGHVVVHQCGGSMRAPWPADVDTLLGEGWAPLKAGALPVAGAREPAPVEPAPVEPAPVEPAPVVPAAQDPAPTREPPAPIADAPGPPPVSRGGCASCSTADAPQGAGALWLLLAIMCVPPLRPRERGGRSAVADPARSRGAA